MLFLFQFIPFVNINPLNDSVPNNINPKCRVDSILMIVIDSTVIGDGGGDGSAINQIVSIKPHMSALINSRQ